jgi:hypothetical protein
MLGYPKAALFGFAMEVVSYNTDPGKFLPLSNRARCAGRSPGRHGRPYEEGAFTFREPYNLLVSTRAALASGLGEEVGGADAFSRYHMATEVAAEVGWMKITVPQSAWQRFVAMTATEFAGWLHEVARGIDWRRYRKRPRGPRKTVVMKRTSREAHRSTVRELNKAQK